MAIKDALPRLRRDRGLTQAELASKLYVTRQAVSRWENGETAPSIEMARHLAEVLEVPFGDLVAELAESGYDDFHNGGLERHEKAYGAEVRQRYGDEAVDAANERLMRLSRDEWEAKDLLEASIKVQLRIALADGDVKGEAAAELARMHARWIAMHWGGSYSRESHLGLAQGYLADQRFRDYYDGACGEGATEFLVAALKANL